MAQKSPKNGNLEVSKKPGKNGKITVAQKSSKNGNFEVSKKPGKMVIKRWPKKVLKTFENDQKVVGLYYTSSGVIFH